MEEQRGLVSPSLLSDIANAIRYKLSTNKTYKLSEMPAAINKIKTGDGVSYTKIVNGLWMEILLIIMEKYLY